MQIAESQSPLTAAADLLRDHGTMAPSEAMERAVKFGRLGDDAAAKFWVEVMIEVFDAQAAMGNHQPVLELSVAHIHRETAGRLVESDRACLRARQTLRELQHRIEVSAMMIKRSEALLRRVQPPVHYYSTLRVRHR